MLSLLVATFVKRYVTVKSFKRQKWKGKATFILKNITLILYTFFLHTYVNAFIGFNDNNDKRSAGKYTCNTRRRSLYTFGPCRFRDRGEGRARCQARLGELPTILRTEAALCGRKRAATFLALNPRARTRDLGTTVAPDRAICKYPPVRGIARTIRKSHLRSLPHFLASLSVFRTPNKFRRAVCKNAFSTFGAPENYEKLQKNRV